MTIRRHRVAALVGALLLPMLACSIRLSSPPTIAPDCESESGPSLDELEFVLDFPGRTFDSSDWMKTYTIEPSRITATWTSNALGAVAYIDYLVYTCGYSQEDLDSYFSEENFQAVFFADYEEADRVATCSADRRHLTLHEFTAELRDVRYEVRFWIMGYGEARVINAILVVPASNPAAMDRLSHSVFAELPSCPP